MSYWVSFLRPRILPKPRRLCMKWLEVASSQAFDHIVRGRPLSGCYRAVFGVPLHTDREDGRVLPAVDGLRHLIPVSRHETTAVPVHVEVIGEPWSSFRAEIRRANMEPSIRCCRPWSTGMMATISLVSRRSGEFTCGVNGTGSHFIPTERQWSESASLLPLAPVSL